MMREKEEKEKKGDRSQESKKGHGPHPLGGKGREQKKMPGWEGIFFKKIGEWEGIFRILSTAIKLDAVL